MLKRFKEIIVWLVATLILSAFGMCVAVPASANPIPAPASLVANSAYGPGNPDWAAYYNDPSNTGTWSGFCQGAGASEVTVSGVAVPGCGPRGSIDIDIPEAYPYSSGSETYTPGFQCVELTDRYMYVTQHWGAIDGNGATVARIYGSAHSLTPVQSRTSGQSPQVGDVISFSVESDFTDDGGEYPGHVAIVSADNVGSSGTGSITIFSENYSGTSQTTNLSVNDWAVQAIQTDNKSSELVKTRYSEWLPIAGLAVNLPDLSGVLGHLNRYDNVATGYHMVTVYAPASGFGFEESLGDLYSVSSVPNTEALYSCNSSAGQFTSTSSTCEVVDQKGRLLGYLFKKQPSSPPTVGLYRCENPTSGDHFDTASSKCEGASGYRSDGLFGYSLAHP